MDWLKNVEWFEYMSWNDCAPIVLVGFSVVFLGLILLVLLFSLSGGLFKSIDKSIANKAKKETPKKAAVKAAPAPTAPAAPVIEDGVSDEIIAVISAAVASMSDGETSYAIRSVKRAKRSGERPAWAMAGIRENTSSF